MSVASARVRLADFAPFLAPHEVALEYAPSLTERQYRTVCAAGPAPRRAAMLAAGAARAILRRRAEHDLLLVHRLRLLAPLPGLDPPPRLDVYDLDDALFLDPSAPADRRVAWAKQEARRCVACMRRARLVIAGNEFLASRARAHARRVEIVPSCVDPSRQPLREHRERELTTIGWIGSATTSPYLLPILPVLERLSASGRRIRLVLVGADPVLRAPWIQHRPWSLASQERDLASFDIGVMPLPDSDWARGKCAYKALQYFAAGVPTVASPVGVAAQLVASGRGAAAASPRDWERALAELVDDPAARRERGAAARAFVERHYSYQRWAPELAALLRSV